MSSLPPAGSFGSGPIALRHAALFTDLYELTMAAAYFREGMHGQATFSLFVRTLPPERGFLLAAGLEDVLEFLGSLRFTGEGIDYLRSLDRFEPDFLDYLRELRFTGDVHAVPEGTPVFADEPLLEITAPIIEAQLVETAVLNFCHVQTVLASKAVRSVLAARGRPVVEFGLRRAHGIDAGMKAARCAFIAGCTMSSNVLAGLEYGIPPTGTMAHSYVTAFPHEIDAFQAFARAFPRHTVLLLDTYDTVAAAHKAVEVAQRLETGGERLAGVRLDSGDIVALSREVRRVLDGAGLDYVQIFASGGFDENEIDRLLEAGAAIDAFGVGTRMDVSSDVPYLDMAYKLVHYDGQDVLKLSVGKETWAGAKQVYRMRGADGSAQGDVIALRDEPAPNGAPLNELPDESLDESRGTRSSGRIRTQAGPLLRSGTLVESGTRAEPLLQPVMRAGQFLRSLPSLTKIRDYCAAQVRTLPENQRRLRPAARYEVRYSDGLRTLRQQVTERLRPPAPG